MSIDHQIKQVEDNDPNLKTLDFTSKELSFPQVQRLAIALKTNTHLDSLKLANTDLTSDGIACLCDGIKNNNTLRQFEIGFNKFSDQDVVKLGEAIANNYSIQFLGIYSLRLSKEGADTLRKALFINGSILRMDVESDFLSTVEKYLKRNHFCLQNPKSPFDGILLERPSNSELSTEEKKQKLNAIFSDLFTDALDIQVASLKLLLQNQTLYVLQRLQSNRGRPENLHVITNAIAEMTNELTSEQIDDILWLARDEEWIGIGHLFNYLFDNCQVNINNLVIRILNKLLPQANNSEITGCVSDFILSIYKQLIICHQHGLIRKWLNHYNDPNIPIPTSAQSIQILLEETLRNAAARGDILSVKLLVHYVKNLNSADATGLVALDYAQCFADATQDSCCADMLQQAGAKSSTLDNMVKTRAFAMKNSAKYPTPSPDEQNLMKNRQILTDILMGVLSGLLVLKIGEIKMQTLGLTALAVSIANDPNGETTNDSIDIIRKELFNLTEHLKVDHLNYLLEIYRGVQSQPDVVSFLIDNYHVALQSMLNKIFECAVPKASSKLICSTTSRVMDIFLKRLKETHVEPVKASEKTNEPVVSKEDDLLIRVWIKEYKSTTVPIPQEDPSKQSLLERALGNATDAGAVQDVVKLISFVKNKNACGSDGRTALHRAVVYANQTKDCRCFNALKEASADMSAKDSNNQTPLDLWDFKVNPNTELEEMRDKLNPPSSCILM